MPETQLCCLFLLAAIFGVLSSGTRVITKYGCRKESIKLFQNISFPNNNTVVSLHKNGGITIMIAEWQINLFNPLNGYRGKLYLDNYGNMWLLNLRESDDATYKLIMGLENNSTINEVELVVMAAPTKKCKPEIVRTDNSLFASVDQTECGKPPASVYWIEHSAYLVSPQVITLQPEQCNCTYHACIKSIALRCADVFNLADYCTVFKWNTIIIPSASSGSDTQSNTSVNVPSTQSGSDMMSNKLNPTALLVTVVVLLILIIVLVILVIWKFNNLFRCNKTKTPPPLDNDEEKTYSKGTVTNPSENQFSSSLQAAKESNIEENEQNETEGNDFPLIQRTADIH